MGLEGGDVKLLRITGGASETASALNARLEIGQEAFCPFENIKIRKTGALTYEKIPLSDTDVSFSSVTITDQAGAGTRNAGLDTDGKVVELPFPVPEGWSVVTETEDFTALNFTVHLVDTSSVDINASIPDASGIGFQTRTYKTTDITFPDVIVTTPSGQEIGGSTTQLIQGKSEGFFAVGHGDHYDIVQESRGGIARKLSQSTTVISGYGISPNAGDTTKIDVASGVFSEELAGIDPVPPATSDLSTPLSKLVKTGALLAVTVDGLATDGYTIFQMDSNGDIQQTLNDVPSQESENISPKIAVIVHAGGAILSAESWWTVGQNPSKRTSWLMNKLGILKEGITTFAASAGNLQFAHDAGIISYAGADGDKSPNNPDEQPILAEDPVSGFILAKQDAFISFTQTAIDPTQIDIGGVLTTLTGNDKVSIQRILINLNGSFTVQYGQNPYATLQGALTSLSQGADSFIGFNVVSKVSRVCAYLVIDRTCTDLTDTALAQFVQTGLLESDGGISATSELITLLKALQNGNSGDGILQVKNIGDATDPQDAVTKIQHDLKMDTVDGVGTGVTELEQLKSNESIYQGGTDDGNQFTFDMLGLKWDGTVFRATTTAYRPMLRQTSSLGTVQAYISPGIPATLGDTVLLTLISSLLNNGVMTLPNTTIADINAEPTGKVLVTREYLGELRVTIPDGDTINITSAGSSLNNNTYIAYWGSAFAGGVNESFFGFGVNKNAEHFHQSNFQLVLAAITNGYSFENTNGSGLEMEVTIKAIGNTDISQLIVS